MLCLSVWGRYNGQGDGGIQELKINAAVAKAEERDVKRGREGEERRYQVKDILADAELGGKLDKARDSPYLIRLYSSGNICLSNLRPAWTEVSDTRSDLVRRFFLLSQPRGVKPPSRGPQKSKFPTPQDQITISLMAQTVLRLA